MKPITTPLTDTVLGAPLGWNYERHGHCQGLPVCRHDGLIISYWKPTWRQRLAILFGRPIRLAVAGEAHPAVCLDTDT